MRMDRDACMSAPHAADTNILAEGGHRRRQGSSRHIPSPSAVIDDEWPDNPGEADCFGGGATAPRPTGTDDRRNEKSL
jgi:hypothetical protein